MLQTFTFDGSLVGGGIRQVDAKGTFFRYESGNAAGADSGLRVRADGNDLGVFYPGDAIDNLPAVVSRWELQPVSTACKGTVRIGMGRVSSARLVGQVELIDGGRARTLANQCFYTAGFITSSVATNRATCQLWNPAGSGRRLVVQRIFAAITQTTWVNWAITTTQAATLRNASLSKLGGGAAGAAQFRTEDSTTVFAAQAQGLLRLAADTSQFWKFAEPLVLPPGQGVVVWGDVTAAVMTCTAQFEHSEETI